MFKYSFLLLAVAGLSACDSNSSSTTTPATTTPPTQNTAPTASTISSCPQDISAGSNLGITALPSNAAQQYTRNFCKYTRLDAPNGRPVHFYAQNRISNEQMVRAREILRFYLSNVPGSQYGSDKSDVWNQMANNNATLIMLNGSDDGNPPADGQTLYETENVVEGSAAYLVNSPRDAAFEEILHLMHDTGIGVDAVNSQPGVRSAYQAEIRAAMNNAAPASLISGGQGLWARNELAWLRELQAEGSLTQEYLAAVIDTYYGLAGQSSEGGRNDLYTPQNRNQISTLDPMGAALMPRYFSEFVTYTARIDASYSGSSFSLSFTPSVQYTHKSQYLLNAQLMGTANTALEGNAQNNRLTGNGGNNNLSGLAGDDVLNGGNGNDTAVFQGRLAEYSISTSNGITTVVDSVANRDGSDTLQGIEQLRFSDQSLAL